jgi:hypothetical protein
MAPFDISKQCCFCGMINESDPIGYAGERCCHSCGKGGHGEPDEYVMAYKDGFAFYNGLFRKTLDI